MPQHQQWLLLQLPQKPGSHAALSKTKDYQEQVLRWSISPERLQDIGCALGPGSHAAAARIGNNKEEALKRSTLPECLQEIWRTWPSGGSAGPPL